jgi:hypothetical protein
MKLQKFRIINDKESQLHAGPAEVTMLINIDHIVSIKPIKIARADGLLEGYWIRTTNGKKYKASIIPELLAELLDSPFNQMARTVDFDENAIQ